MTEPEKSLISGTSILEGMTKAIQTIPKDQRHNVAFVFNVEQGEENKLVASLRYTYAKDKTEFGLGIYGQKTLRGDLVGGVVLNWSQG